MKANRWVMRSTLAFAAISCLSSFAAASQSVDHPIVVELTAVGGGPQTAALNSPVAAPFSLRATDSSGAPVAGVTVLFGADKCADVGGPPCPSDALYGTFGGNDGVSATTDANGVAAASGFVAGSIAGTYNVFAFAPNQEVGGTDYTNTGGSFAYFSIFQVGGLPGGGGGQPASAPTLSIPTLTLLAAILMLAAFANRRKAGKKN